MVKRERDASVTPTVPVRHVLFDADGVLQQLPGGWHTAMRPFLGERTEQFLLETWSDELPTLRGDGDYLLLLEDALRRYGVPLAVEEVFDAVWRNIVVDERSLQLVHAVRTAGYGVHLGTNQEQHRARHMRTTLGYDELFDVSCYSHDLGVAKPDPAFFVAAALRIGDDPAAILFVDDSAQNVDGARAAGMPALHWDLAQGHDVLLAQLREHGVVAVSDEEAGGLSGRPRSR